MHKVAAAVRYIIDNLPGTVPMDKKSTIVAVCLGRAIACQLSLPSSPVMNIQSFYGNTHFASVSEIVASFNEDYVIDTKLAMDMVFKNYRLRYRLAFDVVYMQEIMQSPGTFIYDIVPQDIQDVLTDAGVSANVIDAFRNILIELKMAFAPVYVPPTAPVALDNA